MSETAWIPALAVLGTGGVVGGVLAGVVYLRRTKDQRGPGSSAPTPVSEEASAKTNRVDAIAEASGDRARLDDLRQRRDELITQLRDLEDFATTRGTSVVAQERTALEQEAAAVMRELAPLEAQSQRLANGVSTPRRFRQLLIAIGVVAFVAVVGMFVWKTSRPRMDGMSPTGNTSVSGTNSVGTSGAMGANTGMARPIVAQETERLKQARIRLQKEPNSKEALIAYGYAVAEAGGWIEAFQIAQKILQQDPESADGLIQMSIVRGAMGETDTAASLLERVLKKNPKDVRAMEILGRIALQAGDKEKAIALWEEAKEHGGTAELFDGLIAAAQKASAANQRDLPQGHPPIDLADPAAADKAQVMAGDGDLPAGHPPIAADQPAVAANQPPSVPGHPTAAAAAGPQDLSGTIHIADGVTVPQGAPLYIMLRPAGVTEGPPLAVKRLVVASFPAAFSIGPGNVMMGDPLPPEVSLTMRLDADGNAETKQAGDLVSEGHHQVKLGTHGLDIVLKAP